MQNLKRNVVVLLDNASCHNDTQNYTNIKFIYLPPNTKAKYQSLDAGIIQNVKALYCKRRYMLAVARYRKIKRGLPNGVSMTASQLQDTYKISQLEAMRFLTDVWEHDLQNETIANCWKHTGLLKQRLSRQNAVILDDEFSIQSQPNIQEEVHELVGEIHGKYISTYSIDSSFKEDTEDVREEYNFEDDNMAIIADDPEVIQEDEEDELEKAMKDEQARLKKCVEHLRSFMDDFVIMNDEDFRFNDICNNMYTKYKARLMSARTQQSSITDHFSALRIEQ